MFAETQAATSLRAELDAMYETAFLHLKPVEHVRYIKRAMALHEAYVRETGDNLSFTADIAERTHIHLKTVQRLVARAEAISDEVLTSVEGTPLDKGIVLDELKGLAPAEQELRVRERKAAASPPNTNDEKAAVFLKRFDALPAAVKRAVYDVIAERIARGEL